MSLCVQLSLQGVPVLVIGGGRIAYRKCCQLEQRGQSLSLSQSSLMHAFKGLLIPA